ncbi:unnamed protein product [Musa acuminata var. zebrina]
MAAAIATADPRGRHSPGRRVDDKNLVFDQMGIRDELLRGIYAFGFEKPSAIQQRAVVPIIQGRDVIAQAQSGTGKSSIIALYVCQIIDTTSREISRRSKDHLGIWVAISIHLTTPLPCFPLFSPTVIVLYNIWTRLYLVPKKPLGCFGICNFSQRNSGVDQQVHGRPHKSPCKA